jgi:hypothetical protein
MPFTVHASTPIGFGKLKGCPHERLLIPENWAYSKWIIDQDDVGFRYQSTREYIMRAMPHVRPAEPVPPGVFWLGDCDWDHHSDDWKEPHMLRR